MGDGSASFFGGLLGGLGQQAGGFVEMMEQRRREDRQLEREDLLLELEQKEKRESRKFDFVQTIMSDPTIDPKVKNKLMNEFAREFGLDLGERVKPPEDTPPNSDSDVVKEGLSRLLGDTTPAREAVGSFFGTLDEKLLDPIFGGMFTTPEERGEGSREVNPDRTFGDVGKEALPFVNSPSAIMAKLIEQLVKQFAGGKEETPRSARLKGGGDRLLAAHPPTGGFLPDKTIVTR